MMKLVMSVVLVCAVIAVESVPSPSNSLLTERIKRGFRNGAADRFSHGFGKRTDSSIFGDREEDLEGPNWFISSEELGRLIRTNPKLAIMFVEKYIDTDGDGLITRDEIQENNLRR